MNICLHTLVRYYSLSKPHIANFLAAVAVAGYTQSVLFGWGGVQFTDFIAGNDCVSAFTSFVVMLFSVWRLTYSSKNRWLVLWMAVIFFLRPLQTMTNSGLINAENFDTLMATDVWESLGMLSTIPWYAWVNAAGNMFAFWLILRFTTVRSEDGAEICPKNVIVRAEIPSDATACQETPRRSMGVFARFSGLFKPKQPRRPMTTALFMKQWRLLAWFSLVLIPATTPINDIGRGLWIYSKLAYTTPVANWHVTGTVQGHLHPDNYIIFMSETLSEKGMGLYGAPFDSTPFLSSVPSKRLEKMVGYMTATVSAVSHFVSRIDEEDENDTRLEDNILHIAKEAGMTTHWVSSQGRTGFFEAKLSFIAAQADTQTFVAKHNDAALVPAVKDILKQESKSPRLIFVHAYGAHEPACDRVKGMDKPFKTGREAFFDCYLTATLHQDRVAEGIAKAVEEAGQTYSMIFTSDHALNWRREDGELKAMRNSNYQGSFEVPFVQIGMGVKETGVTPQAKSSARFTDWFPTWIGVTTNQTPANYDIFETEKEPYKIGVWNPDGPKARDYRSLKRTESLAEILQSK